jgi:hypothetical protein
MSPESRASGRFAWIMDPVGNKVDLSKPKARDPGTKDG